MKKELAAFLVLLVSGCAQHSYSGILVSPERPAPDFTLVDQFGDEVSLRDFQGTVVALSFIYASCTTICPIITSKFVATADELGEQVGRDITFLVVTVDPEGDTVNRIKEYSAEKGMLERWHYLTGDREVVEKVWEDYNVYVNKSQPDPSGSYTVDHTGIVYVIDKQGNLRLMYSLRFDPRELAADMRKLSKEVRD
jgi:protein SCO1/2